MRSFKEWLLQNPIFKMLVPDSTFLGLLHYNAEEMEVAFQNVISIFQFESKLQITKIRISLVMEE